MGLMPANDKISIHKKHLAQEKTPTNACFAL